jgi:hypothetical protein
VEQEFVVRSGDLADAPIVTALFDDSIRWMVARDMTAQWGSTPFSQVPERNVGLLRVDCFAGNDGALVRFYERCGYTKTETFTVGKWPGQVLERRVDVTAAA